MSRLCVRSRVEFKSFFRGQSVVLCGRDHLRRDRHSKDMHGHADKDDIIQCLVESSRECMKAIELTVTGPHYFRLCIVHKNPCAVLKGYFVVHVIRSSNT